MMGMPGPKTLIICKNVLEPQLFIYLFIFLQLYKVELTTGFFI